MDEECIILRRKSQTTDVLQDFLPEIMLFADIFAENRHLSVMHLYAVVTPQLRKANADPTNVKTTDQRPLTFKVVEMLVCHQFVAFLMQMFCFLSFNQPTESITLRRPQR